MKLLSREELLKQIGELEFRPDLAADSEFYLQNYLYSKDLQLITVLLQSGANPNPESDLDCWLHYFLHEYISNKTLHGELILAIVEVLLKHGANPNRVWCNNQRAYDYAIAYGSEPYFWLLERYGANPELREYI
jgi:hypothetical protein